MRIITDGLSRAWYELRAYFRAPDQVFFTFLFPLLMFALFAAIFSTQTITVGDTSITMPQYFLAGMSAMAILLSGTQSLAIDIATEKFEGGLQRLGATPLHPVSFFLGKICMVVVTCCIQLVLLTALARLAFGIEFPETAGQWWTLAWLVPLGIACFSALGIALSALPRSARTASAVVIPTVLIPQFLSGVYLPFSSLPEWLQNVSAVLPLKWLAQGMRAVWLPDVLRIDEPGQAWNLGLVAIMLGAWFVAGVVVSLLTFRWTRGRG